MKVKSGRCGDLYVELMAGEWFEKLAYAIIAKAIHDLESLRDGQMHSEQWNTGCNVNEGEIAAFFRSQWFGVLIGCTGIDPDEVRRELKI